nr:LPS-assembly protein like [Ipomoea batatas]
MDVSDADMMEAEHTAAQPSPPPQGLPSNSDHEEAVRNLLGMARQLIDQNKPSQALQAPKVHLLETSKDSNFLHHEDEFYRYMSSVV